jgi:hypothetical protein
MSTKRFPCGNFGSCQESSSLMKRKAIADLAIYDLAFKGRIRMTKARQIHGLKHVSGDP